MSAFCDTDCKYTADQAISKLIQLKELTSAYIVPYGSVGNTSIQISGYLSILTIVNNLLIDTINCIVQGKCQCTDIYTSIVRIAQGFTDSIIAFTKNYPVLELGNPTQIQRQYLTSLIIDNLINSISGILYLVDNLIKSNPDSTTSPAFRSADGRSEREGMLSSTTSLLTCIYTKLSGYIITYITKEDLLPCGFETIIEPGDILTEFLLIFLCIFTELNTKCNQGKGWEYVYAVHNLFKYILRYTLIAITPDSTQPLGLSFSTVYSCELTNLLNALACASKCKKCIVVIKNLINLIQIAIYSKCGKNACNKILSCPSENNCNCNCKSQFSSSNNGDRN